MPPFYVSYFYQLQEEEKKVYNLINDIINYKLKKKLLKEIFLRFKGKF